jgi:hypothetical protein
MDQCYICIDKPDSEYPLKNKTTKQSKKQKQAKTKPVVRQTPTPTGHGPHGVTDVVGKHLQLWPLESGGGMAATGSVGGAAGLDEETPADFLCPITRVRIGVMGA